MYAIQIGAGMLPPVIVGIVAYVTYVVVVVLCGKSPYRGELTANADWKIVDSRCMDLPTTESASETRLCCRGLNFLPLVSYFHGSIFCQHYL